MDTSVSSPVHEHPIIPSARFIYGECTGCRRYSHMYGCYRCTDCYTWFHKECAEAPRMINHPSHPQHSLTLTFEFYRRKCCLCGVKGWRRGYSCSTCDFHVDLTCATKSSPLPANQLPKSHDQREVGTHCEKCWGASVSKPPRYHVGCANLLQEVNHLFHSKHPLMLVTSESLSDVLDKTCLLCGDASSEVHYHCSTCNYTLCPFCAENPPPLTIEHLKTHNHQLTLWPRHISFTCNVCGMQGDRSPYFCFLCDFMIHRECFALPRVININRHDHRISFTIRVGIANSKCGVCRKSVNQYYGGYSCTTCPNYVVHSQCAVKMGVWDMIELEGTPEEPIIPPYIVVGDNLIQHFSHEKHFLRLHQDDVDASSRCEACVRPVLSDPIYSCERCNFVLHETCANLPMKKRLLYNHVSYTLKVSVKAKNCTSCGIFFSGFRYKINNIYSTLDVSCGSFAEPFFFDGHAHSLYYKEEKGGVCVACQGTSDNMLCCDDCDFQVHLGCAYLPKRVKHRSDDHYLTLCYGEEDASGTYWCDICERETDPRNWFYTCSDCGITLHIKCVLGDFSRLMPERITKYWKYKFEVVPNNKNDRPFCVKCNFRCIGPFILKLCDPDTGYVCSRRCLV